MSGPAEPVGVPAPAPAPVPSPALAPVLDVRDLTVTLPRRGGARMAAVSGMNLVLRPGEIVGLAGESGSGKTMTALAALGLLPGGARTGGEILFEGRDLLSLSQRALRDVRGRDIAMVFQDPMTSLHPMLTVERQITDHLRHHRGTSRAAARARALELLETVRIPGPEQALRSYPHRFSGGMRQRIAIAVALACDPKVIIADEPTTALDVTVQAGILRLLDRLRRERDMSVLLITHDLGVMSSLADRISVMYAGRVVENGPRRTVLTAPRHPYTRGLLDALPHPEEEATELRPIPGQPPATGAAPTGCPFHPRCAWARDACAERLPDLVELEPAHSAACLVDPFGPAGPAGPPGPASPAGPAGPAGAGGPSYSPEVSA
ncbi:ABC transporter ATP-binding protein [Streptosporangium sp. DT93]|uniref:ABC transporter ATP-binding protein n=1 Tax=Streptosporangium sp. DT93 TaxID=3393428 RepID=UPI003CE915E3